MKQVATLILRIRFPLLTLFALLTAFLGYHATQLEIATDFSRMVPQGHPFIQAYAPFKAIFGGGNQLRVSVSRREKDILAHDFLVILRKINEDVMFVKGVDRLTVRSIVSPETRYVVINEEGFDMGPVVPSRIPETREELDKVGENITMAGLKGLMVSMDMKSALITAEIYENGVDYLSVYRQLNEIRDRYSDDDLSVHINGFAMVVGFVNDALPKILGLFVLTAFITFLILLRCFRHLRLAVLPLFSGALSVLYSLGIARSVGMSLDPMTTIIPFLVFAIGVSHGIQMIKRYLEECAIHPDGYNAALNALAGLMIPGVVALITDAVGFLTILFVPIGVIRDLAITASIGVACIIVANILVLTLILSLFPNLMPEEAREVKKAKPTQVERLLSAIARATHGRNAYKVTGISLVLLLIGLLASRNMSVGDVNPGEPLLWEDSIYNRDAAKMMSDFMLGIDMLSVVVKGEESGICKRADIMSVVDDYEREIGSVPRVTVVLSALMIAGIINEVFHEGDVRWRTLPGYPQDLAFVMANAGSTDDSEFMTMGCGAMNVRIFLTDHKGDTIREVIARTREFIETHPLPDAEFVLAGGNAGVMAATNEVVDKAQVPMLLLIYAAIFVLCTLVFRNVKAPLLILAPLFLVSVLATAFMKLVGLGLNVNTLPVACLGVGIGVDYGIYIYSRLREECKVHKDYAVAIESTLLSTGAAVLYTALTLSVGVLTWLFSDLKFQADMGLLLCFIFIANMIGAMVLMPALVYISDIWSRRGTGEDTTAYVAAKVRIPGNGTAPIPG